MRLDCFATMADPPPLVPGRPDRPWMDAFGARAPYRCLPLTMANTSGWELLCPAGLTAEWNGGTAASDLIVTPDAPGEHVIASSHFAYGTLTFHPGYLFRTDAGWATMIGGAPNHLKHGIAPLSGLVETDWLPFPATMNWVFTAPGRVRFEKGEPFAFVSVVEMAAVDRVDAAIRSLDSAPDLKAEYVAWSRSRSAFNAALSAGEPEATKASWQRFYLNGTTPPGGGTPSSAHVIRRRLRAPIAE